MTRGDIVLLYCTDDYPSRSKQAPGIGVVTDVDTGGQKEQFKYQYPPLDIPLDLDTIRESVTELQQPGCTNFGFSGNWLREISRKSFDDALKGRLIAWP